MKTTFIWHQFYFRFGLIIFTILFSCQKPIDFQIDEELFKNWKNETINSLKTCCNSEEKTDHFLAESRNLLLLRSRLFRKLMSEIEISEEEIFIITESIQPMGVVGGNWMSMETKSKIYRAHILNDRISIEILNDGKNKIKIPKENKCCGRELKEYKKYRGFINFKVNTVFKKHKNKLFKTVYIRES